MNHLIGSIHRKRITPSQKVMVLNAAAITAVAYRMTIVPYKEMWLKGKDKEIASVIRTGLGLGSQHDNEPLYMCREDGGMGLLKLAVAQG